MAASSSAPSDLAKVDPATGRVAIIGLGYVGLPLAVALAKSRDVVGFDVDRARIGELEDGRDRTGEVGSARLKAARLKFTADPAEIAGCGIYIVTVPTPVDAQHEPDLGAVRAACETVGKVMGKGAIVVFESTVYPGVTEDVCGPDLEDASGLKCGLDFFLGYSPERINPGDTVHTVDKITKVVAGQTPEAADTLAALYGTITDIHVARDIKTAEAAKVIENAQRDINIAFVNEIAMIFGRMGLSVHDVLEAAGTKWNFLPFKPGLVGGHCIGIDPYYLAHLAKDIGHHPEIILAGRRINDGMGNFIADRIHRALANGRKDAKGAGKRVLVLGLTFKENVPDLRNSRVIDVVQGLSKRGYSVDVHDPLADPAEAKAFYGLDLVAALEGAAGYHAVVGAVAHTDYTNLSATDLAGLLAADGLLADIKGIWRGLDLPAGIQRWEL